MPDASQQRVGRISRLFERAAESDGARCSGKEGRGAEHSLDDTLAAKAPTRRCRSAARASPVRRLK
jgi:hypothetical protein